MQKITLFQFFLLGGWAMWPLLIFSAATLGIIIERALFIFRHNLKMNDIEKNVLEKLNKNDVSGAIEYCNSLSNKRPGAQVIAEGLKMAHMGEHRIEKAIESEAQEKIKSLEAGFNLLTALSSISPLTGFLGTVSGMISAFRAIAQAAEINAQLVANGIYEALITTVYGLIIAIFAISFYNIFSHVVDKFTTDLEKTATDVVTTIARKQENK